MADKKSNCWAFMNKRHSKEKTPEPVPKPKPPAQPEEDKTHIPPPEIDSVKWIEKCDRGTQTSLAGDVAMAPNSAKKSLAFTEPDIGPLYLNIRDGEQAAAQPANHQFNNSRHYVINLHDIIPLQTFEYEVQYHQQHLHQPHYYQNQNYQQTYQQFVQQQFYHQQQQALQQQLQEQQQQQHQLLQQQEQQEQLQQQQELNYSNYFMDSYGGSPPAYQLREYYTHFNEDDFNYIDVGQAHPYYTSTQELQIYTCSHVRTNCYLLSFYHHSCSGHSPKFPYSTTSHLFTPDYQSLPYYTPNYQDFNSIPLPQYYAPTCYQNMYQYETPTILIDENQCALPFMVNLIIPDNTTPKIENEWHASPNSLSGSLCAESSTTDSMHKVVTQVPPKPSVTFPFNFNNPNSFFAYRPITSLRSMSPESAKSLGNHILEPMPFIPNAQLSDQLCDPLPNPLPENLQYKLWPTSPTTVPQIWKKNDNVDSSKLVSSSSSTVTTTTTQSVESANFATLRPTWSAVIQTSASSSMIESSESCELNLDESSESSLIPGSVPWPEKPSVDSIPSSSSNPTAICSRSLLCEVPQALPKESAPAQPREHEQPHTSHVHPSISAADSDSSCRPDINHLTAGDVSTDQP